MTNLASVLKSEISRVSRKEMRGDTQDLRKAVSHQRSQISSLRKRLDAMERLVKQLMKARQKDAGKPAGRPAKDAGEQTPRRFSATRLAATRKRLELSAADFGALVGVTGQTIYNWEKGTRPQPDQLEAIAQIRTIGKREAAARLEGVRNFVFEA